MRYLAVCDRFFGDVPGGAYRIAWELARLAKARGHAVSMLCGSTEVDPPAGSSVVEGIEVVRYRFPRLARWSPLRWSAHLAAARRQFEASLGAVAWDVVHGHTQASSSGVWQACGAGPRRIYSLHSSAVLEQRINWDDGTLAGRLKLALGQAPLARAERALFSAAHRVHVLSDFTARELRKLHGGIADGKTVRIPWWGSEHGRLDRAAARRALGWPEDSTVFFSLRRLVRRMGLDLLVEAAARQPPATRLLVAIAGDGPERQALQARSQELGLGERVAFLGTITDEQVAQAYAACDAFVLPTRALEGFGIIAVDALANGRPVIGSDAGAIPEVIGEVLPGWTFPAGDATALARRMTDFAAGRLVQPSEQQLRAFARAHYGREDLERRYLELIEEEAA